jgi:hypothetical protein
MALAVGGSEAKSATAKLHSRVRVAKNLFISIKLIIIISFFAVQNSATHPPTQYLLFVFFATTKQKNTTLV